MPAGFVAIQRKASVGRAAEAAAAAWSSLHRLEATPAFCGPGRRGREEEEEEGEMAFLGGEKKTHKA